MPLVSLTLGSSLGNAHVQILEIILIDSLFVLVSKPLQLSWSVILLFSFLDCALLRNDFLLWPWRVEN